MKNLFLLTGLFLSLTLSAQEVTTYYEVGDNLAKVVVYNGNEVVQQGFIKREGKLWINTGTWKQYDSDGNVTLKVKYEDGKRVETTAYRDKKVIKVYRKN